MLRSTMFASLLGELVSVVSATARRHGALGLQRAKLR